MAGFIKYMKSEESKNLLSNMAANHLLCVIAQRASFKGNPIKGIEKGEAFLGDFDQYGMTRQQYRSSLENLEKWGYITIKTTNKGTIAKLASSLVFCLSNHDQQPTEQPTEQPTSNQQNNQQNNQQVTTIKSIKNIEIEESSLSEKNIFDKRLNLQLPFDVVSTSKTLNATYKKPFLELKDDLKNIFQIDATDEDIEKAIFTFSTVAVASYLTYKGIHSYQKLCDCFINWIPKSIKFESTKTTAQKEQTEDLETYLLQHYRQKDIDYFKQNGKFQKWEALLSENLFKVSNIAKPYKNERITPLLIFELLFLPLGEHLSGGTPERKYECFQKVFAKQTEYNQERGNIRQIIKDWSETTKH